MIVTFPAARLPYYGRFEGAHFETYVAVDLDLYALEGDETHRASNRTTFTVADVNETDQRTEFALHATVLDDVTGTLSIPSDGVPSAVDDAETHLTWSLEYDRDATPTAAEVDAVELWHRYGH
ncbi:hypothetical protein [Halostella pelagica]|uniref:hypothetical protein n=1 Tax=Halostella pelagica TaxID=2583824 RepID=UPI001080C3A1|nr:hypothetical protein [Halostella pelagica]